MIVIPGIKGTGLENPYAVPPSATCPQAGARLKNLPSPADPQYQLDGNPLVVYGRVPGPTPA